MELLLDINTINPSDFYNVVRETHGMVAVRGYKISSLALSMGLMIPVSIVKELAEDKLIIYDHQSFGSETSTEGLISNIKIISSIKPHGVIVFPLAGPGTISAYEKGCKSCGVVPIVALSAASPDLFSNKGGFVDDLTMNSLLAHSLRLGITNFLVDAGHPKTIERVSKILEFSLETKFTALLRFYIQNLSADDQVLQEYLHKLNCCLILPISPTSPNSKKLLIRDINLTVALFKEKGWKI